MWYLENTEIWDCFLEFTVYFKFKNMKDILFLNTGRLREYDLILEKPTIFDLKLLEQ